MQGTGCTGAGAAVMYTSATLLSYPMTRQDKTRQDVRERQPRGALTQRHPAILQTRASVVRGSGFWETAAELVMGEAIVGSRTGYIVTRRRQQPNDGEEGEGGARRRRRRRQQVATGYWLPRRSGYREAQEGGSDDRWSFLPPLRFNVRKGRKRRARRERKDGRAWRDKRRVS